MYRGSGRKTFGANATVAVWRVLRSGALRTTIALVAAVLTSVASSAPAAERESASTLFDEGFVFVSRDDTMRLGAWAQLDGRFFAGTRTGPDTFLVRRARLSAGGTLERQFNYFVMLAAERPSNPLQFAWVEYARWDFLRVRFGQFKQPFGLEELLADLLYEGPERSVWMRSFAPAHDIGAMIHGEGFGGVLDYAIGIFNGRGRNALDNGSAKDLAWRLTTRPFEGVRLSTDATAGNQTESLSEEVYDTAGGFVFARYDEGSHRSGLRTRIGADLEAFGGPVLIRGEVARTRYERVTTKVDAVTSVAFDGGYVEAMWLVTGEQKLSNRPITPLRRFGAFELFARYDRFAADRRLVSRGVVVGVATTDSVSVAVNWWPNRHVRAGLHYVLTDATPLAREHLILLRAQFGL